MLYREFEPSGAARSFIKCYWLLDDPNPSAEAQRVFPDGRSELIFNLAEPFESESNLGWKKQPQSFLVGQITGPMIIRSRGPVKVLGVRFHPHGVSQLHKYPSSEFTDAVVETDDLSSQLSEVPDRLHDCRSLDQQVCCLNQAVVSLASKNSRPVDAAVAFAVGEFERTQGLTPVSEMAHQLGISIRQFQRRFLAAVGITPKQFCRVQRFQRVVRAMDDPSHNWIDTAIRAGYYDQAHLIRDFRQFTGTTPGALLDAEFKLGKLFA